MKYWVTFKIEGRYIAPVEANNIEEAIDKANELYYDANFGELRYCEGDPVVVSDEKDDIVWER